VLNIFLMGISRPFSWFFYFFNHQYFTKSSSKKINRPFATFTQIYKKQAAG